MFMASRFNERLGMNEIDFLKNIINNLCREYPLIREVDGIAGNAHVEFTTSVETIHAWREWLNKNASNAALTSGEAVRVDGNVRDETWG